MLRQDGTLQGIRGLQHEGIVTGGVDAAVSDGHVLATVDVKAVAVGVDGDVVDGGEVAAGHDDSEMTTTVDGDVANGHLTA